MRIEFRRSCLCAVTLLAVLLPTTAGKDRRESTKQRGTIPLPAPGHDSKVSVEQALTQRRSAREYLDEPLTLAEVSQLLWAGQGLTDRRGYRTAPSAGALYPLEVYLIAGRVDGLAKGIYKYLPRRHELIKVADGDKRRELADAALQQVWIKQAPAAIVTAAVYERTTRKYGQRGIRYVHMEVGAACQNVYLQAGTLNLGTVVVGAFDDDQVKTLMKLPADEHPLAIMPVGRKK